MAMGPPPRGRYFGAPWLWRIGEQRGMSSMAEMLEGGAGLRFSLRFDPMRAGFDRALVSFPVSALICRLLGSSNNSSQGRSPESLVVVAAAVALYFSALFLSDQQPRGRRLTASAMARPNSAARPRALPAPGDGLRILSSNDESLENVIHGASIGAGEEEPVLVARVQTRPPYAAVASADGEAEDDQWEKNEPPEEGVEPFKELRLSLLEREQRLELRLMELDSLREQEAAVRELESRVSAAAAEARLLEHKVAALQEENERLRAQASELDAARAELGRAREKLRALRARVEGEQEEARREAAALRERATELERNGEERERALKEEAAAMRKANARLAEENRELALRLQDAEQAASSVNLVLEEEGMVEGANELRETNERLRRQIEQLHGDHCKHVEELVYLKWVNACLRHELRGNDDQHPSSGGQQDHAAAGNGVPSSAVDLSKSMSYRSSEKAKELMLRYGNLGLEAGFDPALFSPLNESLYGDGHDQDHAVAAAPEKRAGHGGKLKFLRNIKKMLASSSSSSSRKGHGHEHKGKKKAPAAAAHDEHFEKAIRWLSSHDALGAGGSSCESTPLSSCQRTPLSSVTTVDSHAAARERGGGGRETAAEPAAASRLPEEAKLARSKSDAGASHGREASRYHALRPEHPAGVGPHHAPEKLRRYSEELLI